MSTPPRPFRIGTFSFGNGPSAPFAGVLSNECVVPVYSFNRIAQDLVGIESVSDLLEVWESASASIDEVLAHSWPQIAAEGVPVSSLKVHAPLVPRQVFCIGANYKRHVVEMLVSQPDALLEGKSKEERRMSVANMMDERAAHGTPYAFQKSAGAVTGPFDDVVLPSDVQQPDWELELAVIIGREAYRVSEAQALQYVAGYTIANDVTARDFIYRRDIKAVGTDWLAGKSRPTFLPLGPYIVPSRYVPNPQDLRITLTLNGDVMQDESTSDMVFSIARQIAYLSSLVRLRPGDVICTGSPAGNGTHHQRFLRPGDVMEGSITGLGSIRNRCIAELRPCRLSNDSWFI
jgi:2,4-diketo-3-deoxy-L-fuconate hydrolase